MFSNFKLKTDKLKNWILDIFFPKYCLSCDREGFYVCPECFAKIPVQYNFYCYICGRRSPEGKSCPECKSKIGSTMTGLLVASDWNNLLVRQMIYECKYRFVKEMSLPLASILIKFLYINNLVNWPSEKSTNQQANKLTDWSTNELTILPVPLHKRRLSWRGFNQALLLAEQINRHLKIPVIADLLVRPRHTPPQMDIKDKIERMKNVASAFALNHRYMNKYSTCEQVRGKVVILIDDVCTTGSTLEECARVLKPLRPKEIWGLVIARG